MVVSVDGAGVAVLPPCAAGVGGEGVARVAGVGEQVLRVLKQRPQLRVQHVEPEMKGDNLPIFSDLTISLPNKIAVSKEHQ